MTGTCLAPIRIPAPRRVRDRDALAATRPALHRRPGRRRVSSWRSCRTAPICRCPAISSSTSCFRRWCSRLRCSSTGGDSARSFRLTLTLAFLGVAIAAGVVAGGMHWLIGWSWIGAALFGMLIAATDPVSVIASFREMGCELRLSRWWSRPKACSTTASLPSALQSFRRSRPARRRPPRPSSPPFYGRLPEACSSA